ncbi:membrane carboxypeptidase/penicillin-binding protein [Glaciecola sp. KUL10]|nr:membrane carboxypeptidase/penicillin-binding protein [Glaciecola sp. KUL10]
MLLLFSLIKLTPKPILLSHYTSGVAVYDRKGNLLRLSLSEDDKYRLITPASEFPSSIKQASIQYEDKNFYEHKGADLKAILRAGYQTYIVGKRRIGASTITMQVARLRWNIDSSTVLGKFEQIIRALHLESHYSKKEILSAYLNLAPYGANIEGAQAASLIYFGKHVSKLSELEAISLAVIPQNPNARNPAKSLNHPTIQNAAKRLFLKSPELFEGLSAETVTLPLTYSTRQDLPYSAPHFVQYLRNLKGLNETATSIESTLDLEKQTLLEKVLSQRLQQSAELEINNASALLVNYKTMQIEAMLGSADFHNTKINGQVNGALAERSPGSTLKPLLYALGFEAGLIHPQTLVKDLPVRYLGFSPENADTQYKGAMNASDALLASRNVPAVGLQKRLSSGEFNLYDALKRYEVNLKPADFYGLALSLGGLEMTMLDLVKIYASFANGGIVKNIKATKHDINRQGEDVPISVLSKEASFMLLNTLAKHKRPLGFANNTEANNRYSASPQSQPDIAWKTGTSWGFRDAWALGISGDYVLAVWVGNFDGKANPSFKGFEAAGPILFDMFDSLTNANFIDLAWNIEDAFSSMKGSLRRVSVCKPTGGLNEKGCPLNLDTYFIPGKSPIKSTNIYRLVNIHKATGLRACKSLEGDIEQKYFEVWPTDILANFERVGILVAAIPDFHQDCLKSKRDSEVNLFSAPKITSPLNGQVFVNPISAENQPIVEIALSASVDGDTKKLNWFVNGNYIGSVTPTEPLFHQFSSGAKTITLSDDQGQVTSVNIIIKAI